MQPTIAFNILDNSEHHHHHQNIYWEFYWKTNKQVKTWTRKNINIIMNNEHYEVK